MATEAKTGAEQQDLLSGMEGAVVETANARLERVNAHLLKVVDLGNKKPIHVTELTKGLRESVKMLIAEPHDANRTFLRLGVIFLEHCERLEKHYSQGSKKNCLAARQKESFEWIINRNVGEARTLLHPKGQGKFVEELDERYGSDFCMLHVIWAQQDHDRWEESLENAATKEQAASEGAFEKIKLHFKDSKWGAEDAVKPHFFALRKQRQTQQENFETNARLPAILGLVSLGLSVGFASKPGVNLATHISLSILAAVILVGYVVAYRKWSEVAKEIDGPMCEQYMSQQGIKPGAASE